MSVTWHGITITCEIGLASLPSVAIGSTSWTDVSAYVRSIGGTRRGRNSETGGFETGALTVTLDNRDRRFDPNYASGPYFGNLVPKRRIRLRFTYSAVTYAVWHGFVKDWPQSYHQSNHDATVVLQADDGFAVLNLLTLPESVWALTIPDDSPVGWWRLGETSGTRAIDSSGNGHDGTYVGGATFNSTAGLIYGGDDAAIAFDGVDDYITVPPALLTTFPLSMEAWISGTSGLVYIQESNDGKHRLSFSWTATTLTSLALNIDGSGTGHEIASTATVAAGDGNPHHVVATFADTSSAPLLYLDGAVLAVTPTVTGTPVTWSFNDLAFIGGGLDATGVPINATDGTIDEVAIYSSVLSAGTIAAHYAAGTTPWEGDATGTRIGRLLDLVAWPSADRTIAAGVAELDRQALAHQTVLGVLQAAELSEGGQLFMGADGTVVFRDRHWRFENTLAINSQATFGDDGTGSELPYAMVETDGGADFIANRVRFSSAGGVIIDLSDATSISKYYERTIERSGYQNDDGVDIRYLAEWYLATHKDPIPRITSLTVYPRRDPTNLIPVVLTLDIGHRVTVKRRPQNVGTALSSTHLIEEISHRLDHSGDWQVMFSLSAADTQSAVQPLVLDDATYGLLDTNVLAY